MLFLCLSPKNGLQPGVKKPAEAGLLMVMDLGYVAFFRARFTLATGAGAASSAGET